MWKLRSIYAENLCAFRELDYTPLQGVTTLVFGNNLDNDSQNPTVLVNLLLLKQ